jgi:hypothetical protein
MREPGSCEDATDLLGKEKRGKKTSGFQLDATTKNTPSTTTNGDFVCQLFNGMLADGVVISGTWESFWRTTVCIL